MINKLLMKGLLKFAVVFANATAFVLRRRLGYSKAEWEKLTQAVIDKDIVVSIRKKPVAERGPVAMPNVVYGESTRNQEWGDSSPQFKRSVPGRFAQDYDDGL